MPEGYHHLTIDQRCQIYTLKKRGDSASVIANELKVHGSTVYREMKRNTGSRGYSFKQANEKAVQRHQFASSHKRKMTSYEGNFLEELQWSQY